MYIEHPYFYEGKYYANIDGEMIEITKEVAYAMSLDMNIYSWNEDIEDGESVMTAEYRPVEYGKDYDVVNNSDKFQLYIDRKEIK